MSRLAVSVLLFNQEYVMFDIEKIVIKFCSSVSARLQTSRQGRSFVLCARRQSATYEHSSKKADL
jgi:hypothetical protein